MIATSLRTRVFMLIAAIVALLAAFLMLITQRGVTATVYGAEERSAANILNLVGVDIESRYRHLLREKIASVRGYRDQLESYGDTVQATLAAFAAMAGDSPQEQARAQRMALDWINTLPTPDGMQVMVYDHSLRVLAHPLPVFVGTDLSGLRDIKGRTLASDVYRQPDPLFGVYRWPHAQTGELDTHFGYFRRFPAWQWVVAVSNNASAVEHEVNDKRNNIVMAVADTLNHLTLAQSGFLFVFSGNGDTVIPAPARASSLIDSLDDATGKSLQTTLMALARRPTPTRISFTPQGGQAWELGATYVKPLDWYVAAAVPRSDLLQPAQNLLQQQGAAFLAILAVALLLAWLFASRLIRPLNILTHYARQLPERDLTLQHPVPDAVAELPARYRDEVGRLASNFLYMEEQLRGNVLRLMAATSARERIESELSIARDIQLGLLPIALEPHVLRQVDLFATMTAAKEVGGDLYDYFMMGEDRLCFAIGDVSGKGVPAALFMAITRTLIRSAANQESEAGRLMEVINTRLTDHNPNMMFVTLFIGILDLRTGELQYANGGHPPPWLVSADGVSLLAGRSGPACGVAESLPYADFNCTLAPGTILVGYTDGVTEADNPAGAFYGDERGVELLRGLPANCGSEQTARALHDDVLAFAQGAEQADDITLIVIRRLAPTETPS